MITLLTETSETSVDGPAGDKLWLSREDAEAATGWQLKPEGFCKGDVCVPIPAGRAAEFVRDGQVNVSAFWALMGKPATASDAGDVWSLGEGAQTRNDALLSLEAPEFTLPDFQGKPHSLSDFRRQRVLLITWASW
jgi:hypothetical protein